MATNEEKIRAAFSVGYEPREVMKVTGATRVEVNSYLNSIRASQRYMNRSYGTAILSIYANI
jgi:hypothetical protein